MWLVILTFDPDGARDKPPRLHVQHARVILRHHGTDVHTGLYGQMEGALFEGQQDRFPGITPRALGEDEDVLSMLLHFPGCPFKRLHRLTPVHTVNKHRAG